MTSKRRIQLAILTLAAFGLAWAVTWYMVRDHVQQGAEYFLTAERLEVTPPPPWIRSDIKGEVLRSVSLDRPLSILDEDLNRRIHDAFPLHPWVASVGRVTKEYPAKVKVELIYRRPVCMVEVPGGLFAVDAEGVLLPSADFLPHEAQRYPRLAQVNSVPLGQVGMPWGDPRVAGGSRLAAFLIEHWGELRLAQIVPSSQALDEAGEVFHFDLFTLEGTRIRWGRPPGVSPEGESPVEEKIARLKDIATRHGSLDSAGQKEIDLRPIGDWRSAPHTAAGTEATRQN